MSAIKVPLKLCIGNMMDLTRYLAKQLDHLAPAEDVEADTVRLAEIFPRALERMRPILEAVRSFDPTTFDHFNSLQHATLLYLLANEAWRCDPADRLADRLFCLNRAMHSIDLFYAVQMPEVFFISHGLGAVLGNATYGNHLVIFQNVTVGRVGEDRPIIGKNVTLFPGAVVTGNAVIGDNSVIAAGTVVHGASVPDNTIAKVVGGEFGLFPRKRDFSSLYFRVNK